MAAGRYLKTLSILLCGTLLLTGLLNWAVDPYRLFHFPAIDGFNRHKSDLYKFTRLSLAHNVWAQAPQDLLLGSSRSYFGFDTGVPFADGQRYFNLSLPAANLYEMERYLQHAQQRAPTRRLLLGLDMFMFNRHQPVNETFSEDRLAVAAGGRGNPGFRTELLREEFQALFSYDALLTSLRTVAKQPLAKKYDLRGFEGEAIGLVRDVRQHGQRLAFHRVQAEYPQKWCPPPSHRFEPGAANDPDTPLGRYRRLLRQAYDQQIAVHLFITPSHAYLWEAMDRAGLWETFEAWKRALVVINEEEAARAARPAYPLWDFSGYNRYTTEAVPAAGDGRVMQWYWEASHFRPALGERVQARLFAPGGEGESDFGVPLRSDNIGEQLQQIRHARDRYRLEHAEEMREIDALGITPALCRQAP